MQLKTDLASKITLIEYSNKFAQHYSLLKNTDTLYVIVGSARSGKSVFIDLLSGKQLTVYEDLELQTKIVVQTNNFEHEYHPLYIKKFNQSLSMQSFTLQQGELTPSGLQNIKLIFLQQFLKICSKVAFIVLVQQSDKQMIFNYLEALLNNLGILPQNNQNVEKLKEYIYLLITKTEQEGQLQESKQMLKEQVSNIENENVKEIVNYLVEKDLIDQFRAETPQNDYADIIKNKFKPKKFDIKSFDILSKSPRRIDNPFKENDKKQLINHLGQISKLITYLILFASTEEKIYQRQYETLAKALYPDNKKRNQINSMIGKWNKSSLSKIKNLKRLSTLKKVEEKFQVYSQCFIELLKTLQLANEDKTQFKQIEGKIVFFTALSWCFLSPTFNNQIKQIIQHFTNAITKAQSAEKPKIQAQNQSKPKPAKPPGKKNAANIFKESIEKCRNNGEAFQKCLSVIKQKEKEEKYDYFQVIFYIKLLRDLLQEFVSPNLSQSHIFIKELLQISLYTENYYDFENYLKSALRSKVLQLNETTNLLKTLYDTNKFQYCQKLVDYFIAECKDSEQFLKFSQLKLSLKIKINDQYKNRQKQNDVKAKIEGQKKKISFSFDDLVNKSHKNSSLRAYFERKDFENHIASKQ